jgi:hypothetical protein
MKMTEAKTNQKMWDVEQNNFMKEYVDSAAGYETTIEEAKEFIQGLIDSEAAYIDDLKMM